MEVGGGKVIVDYARRCLKVFGRGGGEGGRKGLVLYGGDVGCVRKWYFVLKKVCENTLESCYEIGEEVAMTLHWKIVKVRRVGGGGSGDGVGGKRWDVVKSVSRKRCEHIARTFCWVAKNVKHFAIVEFLEVFESPSHVHVVMRMVRGGSLCSMIRKGGLSVREARRVFKCVVKAVGYLHGKGVAHWGIRSERILLENMIPPHRPRLVGFGDAKRFVKGKTLNLLPHFHYMSSGRLKLSTTHKNEKHHNKKSSSSRESTNTPTSILPSRITSTVSSASLTSTTIPLQQQQPSNNQNTTFSDDDDDDDEEKDNRLITAYSSHYNIKPQHPLHHITQPPNPTTNNDNDSSFSTSTSFSPSTYTTIDPHFASPEMLSGAAATYPTECDLWALGILLFEMIFGHLPFTSPRGWDHVAASVLTFAELTPAQRKERLFARVPEVDHELVEDAKMLILRLLEPRPENRILPGACLKMGFFGKGLERVEDGRAERGGEGLGEVFVRGDGKVGRTQSAHVSCGGLVRADDGKIRRFASIREYGSKWNG